MMLNNASINLMVGIGSMLIICAQMLIVMQKPKGGRGGAWKFEDFFVWTRVWWKIKTKLI